jgi:hypothetical protein
MCTLHIVCCAQGGGGLLAGVASYVKALRPHVRVIGVEAEDAAGMTLSLQVRPNSLPTLDRLSNSPRSALRCVAFADRTDHHLSVHLAVRLIAPAGLWRHSYGYSTMRAVQWRSLPLHERNGCTALHCTALHCTALQRGERTELGSVGLFADGAAVKFVGRETFRVCHELVDEMITERGRPRVPRVPQVLRGRDSQSSASMVCAVLRHTGV